MNCNTVNKKLIPYFNNELSGIQKDEMKNHLESCKGCYDLYSELEITFGMAEKKEVLRPNPFLYTRISQKINDIKSREEHSVFSPVYNKAVQLVFASAFVIAGFFGGVKLGSLNTEKQHEQVLVAHTTEYFLDDLSQEKIELMLLNE